MTGNKAIGARVAHMLGRGFSADDYELDSFYLEIDGWKKAY